MKYKKYSQLTYLNKEIAVVLQNWQPFRKYKEKLYMIQQFKMWLALFCYFYQSTYTELTE